MKQEMMGWQWYQLNYMYIIYTSIQTDNHVNTSPFRLICKLYNHTHACTHAQPFYSPLGFCLGPPRWVGTRKV